MRRLDYKDMPPSPPPNKDLPAPIWGDSLSWLNTHAHCMAGGVKPPLSCFSNYEIWEMGQEDWACVPRTVALCRLLKEALGTEEAGKRIQKTLFDEYYEYGRRAAEMLGNPKDMDSFCNTVISKAPPAVPAPIWVYRTEKKAIFRTGCVPCTPAKLFRKYCGEDKELLAFIAEYLDQWHDFGWVKGFNPDIITTHTKHFVRGDDCCEYVFELP